RLCWIFFFQAEDGIRCGHVTGVQTCALPILYLDNRNGTFVSNPIVATDGTVFTTAIINTPGGGNSRNIRRPDRVPAVDPILRSGGLAYLNPAAFAMPQPGTFGNLARNAFKGPHFVQLDFTLSKRFIIRE